MKSIALLLSLAASQTETRQATGVKVGEVTDASAIVWMRVTAKAAREADGAAPGAPGRVRVRFGTKEDLSDAQATEWAEVRAERDFAHQFPLKDLKPATVYHYAAETEGHGSLRGRFETAPRPDVPADVTFTVITGMAIRSLDDPQGFAICESMPELQPKFIIPTGDTVYYDNDPPNAKTVSMARFHWNRMYSLPKLVDFHLKMPGYWMKDDHDLLEDDCSPQATSKEPEDRDVLTYSRGQKIFREQVPMGEKTYRRVRWGRDLELWLMEGRDFRSSNQAPDGPEKTIWGAEQKAWLKKTMLESDATWKILVSPTPIVGPDKAGVGANKVPKVDNHVNDAFAHEGNEIRRWIRENNKDGNIFVVCGDRHWQYYSVHPETGVKEFCCGPASDAHAGQSPGFNEKYHRFHREGGGFLSVHVGRPDGRPEIQFRFNIVYGGATHTHTEQRKEK